MTVTLPTQGGGGGGGGGGVVILITETNPASFGFTVTAKGGLGGMGYNTPTDDGTEGDNGTAVVFWDRAKGSS